MFKKELCYSPVLQLSKGGLQSERFYPHEFCDHVLPFLLNNLMFQDVLHSRVSDMTQLQYPEYSLYQIQLVASSRHLLPVLLPESSPKIC